MRSAILSSEPKWFFVWKKGLSIAALFLGVFHILLALFRYFFDFWLLVPYERWFSLALAVNAFLIFLVEFFFFPNNNSERKSFWKRFCSYEQLFMIALFFWYAIVCAVLQATENIPYFKMEDWWILDTGISALILFPLAGYAGKEKARSLINFILHVALISYTVFTAWALWHIFRLESVVLPSGEMIEMSKDMKLYFCVHYNTTGAIACIMLAFSLYMIINQKLIGKIFYSLAFILHLIVLMLSNSRTSFLAALFMIVCAAFCYFWFYIGEIKRISSPKRAFLSFLIALICGFFLWQLRSIIIEGFDTLTGFSKAMSVSARKANIASPAVLSSVRTSLSIVPIAAREITPDLNGRTDIWLAALKVIFSSPKTFFFGVAPVGITHALVEIGGLTEEFYGTHNAFLDVATEFGIPAMIAFLLFSVRIVFRSFHILFQVKHQEFKQIFLIPLTVLTIFVLNLTEGYLIASFSFPSSVFFLLCGWILVLDRKPQKT